MARRLQASPVTPKDSMSPRIHVRSLNPEISLRLQQSARVTEQAAGIVHMLDNMTYGDRIKPSAAFFEITKFAVPYIEPALVRLP